MAANETESVENEKSGDEMYEITQFPNFKPKQPEADGTMKLKAKTSDLPPVITLDVGGHTYRTRLSTLRKYPDSMLAAMFSGRYALDKDANGHYFIDNDGKLFKYILEFLRHETLPPASMVMEVYKEASYYNIGPLVNRLQTMPVVAKVIVDEAHRAQFPDYHGVKKAIIKKAIELASVDTTAEVLVSVCSDHEMIARAGHECECDQAHVKVGPWREYLIDRDNPNYVKTANEDILIQTLLKDLREEGYNVELCPGMHRCKCCKLDLSFSFSFPLYTIKFVFQ